MNAQLIHNIFILTLILSVITTLAFWFAPRRLSLAAALITIASSGALVCLTIFTQGRLPAFGAYESLPFIVLIAGTTALLDDRLLTKPRVSAISWPILAVLLGLTALRPFALNPDYFMYALSWAQGFFCMRIVAMGLLLSAAVPCLCALLPYVDQEERNILATRGRVHIILAAAAFLAGELSGSVWCLFGWGDTWHWSKNFFVGYGMFLLIMVPCHLPRILSAVKTRAAITLCSSTLILAYFVTQQLLDS